jgi:hypothetical protein
MPISPFLNGGRFDPETLRILGVASWKKFGPALDAGADELD